MKNKRFNYWNILIYGVLIIFALLCLYPFIYTIAGSLNDALDLQIGPVWFFPRQFTLSSYIVILRDERLYRSLLNTFIETVVGLILALVVTSMAAYAFSSRHLRFRKAFWFYNLIPMLISGGMIPYYVVMLKIGLYNNFLIYILPGAYSVFNMIILQNFFKTIDPALYDAAVMDGASEIYILRKIYVPLSMPAISTIALWIVVGRWNAYTPTMLYTDRSEKMWLLQYYLMRLIRDGDVPQWRGAKYWEVNSTTLSFAAIIVTTLPIILIYPFVMKKFVKGEMDGSIKG